MTDNQSPWCSSNRDGELRDLVASTYRSLRVTKSGGIRIDPAEVRQSPEFKDALTKAKAIVQRNKNDC